MLVLYSSSALCLHESVLLGQPAESKLVSPPCRQHCVPRESALLGLPVESKLVSPPRRQGCVLYESDLLE
jgi:hypothetical protein